MTHGGATVELRSVSKRMGQGALALFQDFSLKVDAGETLAIVGPSGCGKSTLLNLVALLDGPDAGDVVHDGAARAPGDQALISLGYIFQRDALLPWATVMQNILVGAECRDLNIDDATSMAHAMLQRLGLQHLQDRYPVTLSGGQRQLVALVQNRVIRPRLLLLDEPFAHLDYQSKLVLESELLGLIRAARQDHPMTTLLVSHDIEEAVVIADRIVVIGGYPLSASRIVRRVDIEASCVERDPIRMRESDLMPRYFREVWDAIRSVAPQGAGGAS
jgi:NitT/TauT family transport system ATP-binding protein